MNTTPEKPPAFRAAVVDQTMGYIVAAFGLVAGLAWNEAIKSAIDYLFPSDQNGILAQFGYAVVMTIVVVILTMILRRVIGLVKPNGAK